MATIMRQSFTTANIADFAEFISNMGFSDTDFSVSGQYDFIANSNGKIRLKINNTNLVVCYVVGDTETSIVTGATISARLVTTASGSALSVYQSVIEVTPQYSQLIILAPAKSTDDGTTNDILIVGTGTGNSNKFFAPDMLAFGNAEALQTPITDSLNTVLYKLSGSKTYYIPTGLYGIKNTNADLSRGYYHLTLNDVDYETIGYLALRD